MTSAHLHILAGKIGAGKSTLAAALAQKSGGIVIREDEWLAGLFGSEMATIQDYVRASARLRAVMEPHVVTLLVAGLTVVLDFPANTPGTRVWLRRVAGTAGCGHTLHFLDIPDDICRDRLRSRNAGGTHEFAVSEEQFAAITRHFVPPSAEEGFEIRTYGPGDQT